MARQYGVDVSGHQSDANWRLFEEEKEFVVVEAYQPGDPSAPPTNGHVNDYLVRNAQAVRTYQMVLQFYHFPNAAGPADAAAQVGAWMKALDDAGIPFEGSMVWFDIEASWSSKENAWVLGPYWPDDPEGNVRFIQALIDALEDPTTGKPRCTAGIYTNESSWRLITGSTEQFCGVPLWWSHNGTPPDVPFTRFGGWTSFSMIQYAQEQGNSDDGLYDLDWYPTTPTTQSSASE